MANPLYGSNKFDELAAKVIGGVDSPDGGLFTFSDNPVVGDHGGVDTASCIHMYDDGLKLIVQNIGTQTAGTAAGPVATSAGMNYSYDGADDEGIQWCLADANAKGYWNGPKVQKYKSGSAAFFASLTFTITDVSDTDDCAFGFRKVEAFQAAIDDYDEMACLNVISGDIKSETIINNASTVVTDLTAPSSGDWADGAVHTLKVKVAADGAVTYELDGIAPTGAVAYSFDAGEVVTPFFYLKHAAASSAGVILHSFEHGRQ